MLKLGLDTWLFAVTFEKKHLYSIKEAAELGAEAIDFSINNPDVFPVKEAAELVKEFGIMPITSTAFPIECNPISPKKSERENAVIFMKKLIDITAELGAKVTGGVNYAASGYHSGKLRSDYEIDLCLNYLRTVCDYAKPMGIDIAVEPVKRFESHFLNRASQALELIEKSGLDNLKVHLDTFHMNIEEADLPDAIRSCGNKLAHMHLVDSNRGVPGMGHTDWIGIFKALKDINYQGAGCIETFNPETLEETCMMTFLTQKFAETPRELSEKGLKYLRAVRTIVFE